MATHSSTLAWIPWTEEPRRLHSPWGCKESDMTERLHFHFPALGIRPDSHLPTLCASSKPGVAPQQERTKGLNPVLQFMLDSSSKLLYLQGSRFPHV